MSSDGGLCGGIHSSISRYIKKELAGNPQDLIVLGDKPKAQLSRIMGQNMRVTFSGVGKDVPTFAEACAIADEIGKFEGGWDEVSASRKVWFSSTTYDSTIPAPLFVRVQLSMLLRLCGSY